MSSRKVDNKVEIELYWDDLTYSAQRKVLERCGIYDMAPDDWAKKNYFYDEEFVRIVLYYDEDNECWQ